MSIDKLMKLKSDLEAALALKVPEQRRALEAELSRLPTGKEVIRLSGGRSKISGKSLGDVGGSRLKPRWLAAAIKSGKSLDDSQLPHRAGSGRPKYPVVGNGDCTPREYSDRSW
jgi:hypothetical protein